MELARVVSVNFISPTRMRLRVLPPMPQQRLRQSQCHPRHAVFYEVEFRDNSGAFTETVTQDPDTLSVAVEQSLVGVINCRDQELRNLIQDMAGQACGLVCVHVENTGNYWIWGAETIGAKKRPARLTNAEGLSGALFTDSNQETLTISCRTTNKARFIVDGATVMDALD
jgi:hypothetical protein